MFLVRNPVPGSRSKAAMPLLLFILSLVGALVLGPTYSYAPSAHDIDYDTVASVALATTVGRTQQKHEHEHPFSHTRCCPWCAQAFMLPSGVAELHARQRNSMRFRFMAANRRAIILGRDPPIPRLFT